MDRHLQNLVLPLAKLSASFSFFLFLFSFFFFLFLLDTCRTASFPRQIESLLHAKHPKSDSRTRDPQPQNQTQHTHTLDTNPTLAALSDSSLPSFLVFLFFFSQIIHRTLNGRHHHVFDFSFLFNFFQYFIFNFHLQIIHGTLNRRYHHVFDFSFLFFLTK